MSAAEGMQFFVDVMDATDKVFPNMCDNISFEAVYRRVFYLVLHKHGHTLQRTLEAKFQEYAGKVLCHQRFHSSGQEGCGSLPLHGAQLRMFGPTGTPL